MNQMQLPQRRPRTCSQCHMERCNKGKTTCPVNVSAGRIPPIKRPRTCSQITKLTQIITNSLAPWVDKEKIIDSMGIMVYDKITVLISVINNKSNNSFGKKINALNKIYKISIENFHHLKQEYYSVKKSNLRDAHQSYLVLIRNFATKGWQIQSEINHAINNGVSGLEPNKKNLMEAYKEYLVIYMKYMDAEFNTICPTVYLNDDVKGVICSYL